MSRTPQKNRKGEVGGNPPPPTPGALRGNSEIVVCVFAAQSATKYYFSPEIVKQIMGNSQGSFLSATHVNGVDFDKIKLYQVFLLIIIAKCQRKSGVQFHEFLSCFHNF